MEPLPVRRLNNLARDDRYYARQNRFSSSIADRCGEESMRHINNDERQLKDVFTAERALLYKHSPT